MTFLRRNAPPRPPMQRISKGRVLAEWERYLERSLDFMEKGAYDDALADIDAAIVRAPRVGELYAVRGFIFFHQRKDEEAEAELSLAFKVDKHQWLLFYVRGLLAMRKKDFDAAVEAFSQAQRFVPTRPEVLHSRAMAFYGQGDLDRAIADLEYAVEVTDSHHKHYKDMKKRLDDFKRENR